LSHLKKVLSRIKDFFSDFIDIPSSNLSPKREEEIINKIASVISRWDMEIPASLLGKLLVPTSSVISQIHVMPSVLYLDLIGLDGFEVAAFLDNKENVKRLLAKIQELKDAKEYD
jgi:hypothetical protein